MTSLDSETQFELERLMTEFAWRIDHGHADQVHDLFIESGSISAPGLNLNSREEIATQFGERAKDGNRVSRHSWMNPRFEVLAPDRIRVTTVVQTFMGSTAAGESLPIGNANFIVGDSIDVMQRDQKNQWRFESRQLQVLFAPPK